MGEPRQFVDERGMYRSESSSGSESHGFRPGPVARRTVGAPVGGRCCSMHPSSTLNSCRPGRSGYHHGIIDAGVVLDHYKESYPPPAPRGWVAQPLEYDCAVYSSPKRDAPSNTVRHTNRALATGVEMVTCVNSVLARINEALTKIDNGIREVGGNSEQHPSHEVTLLPPGHMKNSEPAAFDSA